MHKELRELEGKRKRWLDERRRQQLGRVGPRGLPTLRFKSTWSPLHAGSKPDEVLVAAHENPRKAEIESAQYTASMSAPSWKIDPTTPVADSANSFLSEAGSRVCTENYISLFANKYNCKVRCYLWRRFALIYGTSTTTRLWHSVRGTASARPILSQVIAY